MEFFNELNNKANLSKDSTHLGFFFLCYVTGVYDHCTISLTCNTEVVMGLHTTTFPENSSKHCRKSVCNQTNIIGDITLLIQ